jgi:hypothetical protein
MMLARMPPPTCLPTGPTLSALNLSRSTVAGCKSLAGTVTLTAPAVAAALLNEHACIGHPSAVVTVPEGLLSKKILYQDQRRSGDPARKR